MYDYIIVGAGLFGSVCARELTDKGYKVLVLEKRSVVGGNIYTERQHGIDVHVYGAHIFHTSNVAVWKYVNRFADFNNYINSPIANYKGELYNLPFNMNTFHQMWGINTPAEAERIIDEQKTEITGEPQNLEEQAISLVGRDIYEKLVKSYTEKQWGRSCTELPAFIIRRLPVRYTYNNNYFNDHYQGIPVDGYTSLIDRMLDGIEVRIDTDFLKYREQYENQAEHIIFTGAIDEYYNFKFGSLEWRSLRFETEMLDVNNYQGVAVMNFTDSDTPYTRIIEHKHFDFGTQDKTVISKEYSVAWKPGDEPYYPVNCVKNERLYEQYKALAENDHKVIFGGRLGSYKYYDMDKVIEAALNFCDGIPSLSES